MKNSIFAVLALFAMAGNFAAPSLADTKGKTAKGGRAAELVSLLPASDAVVTVDAARAVESMPALLAGNPTLLGKVTAEIEKMQSKTGIDIKQFKDVAVGVNIKQGTGKNYDFDPVMVARGQVNATAIISAAKLAANGKYREAKVGGRSIYIISPAEVARQHATGAAAAKAQNVTRKLGDEMAITAYDASTIVGGSVGRVRELLAGTSRVSPELSGYLGRTDGSIMDFAARAPGGLRALIPLDDDELGRNIDSIRFLYGSMSVNGEAASINATAKTLQPENAKGLKDTLDGLQMLGKAFLSSSRSADKQVYGRMVENARFTQTGNEVNIAISVPQSDINVLVGTIK
jgi:hypothetical protein